MIKKFMQEVFNKWIVGIAVAFLFMFGTAALDYFNRFWSLPETVEQNQLQRQRDSTFASEYMKATDARLSMVEKNNFSDSLFLEADYRDIAAIKKKLKLK